MKRKITHNNHQIQHNYTLINTHMLLLACPYCQSLQYLQLDLSFYHLKTDIQNEQTTMHCSTCLVSLCSKRIGYRKIKCFEPFYQIQNLADLWDKQGSTETKTSSFKNRKSSNTESRTEIRFHCYKNIFEYLFGQTTSKLLIQNYAD